MSEDKYWIDDFGVRVFEPVENPKEGTTLCQKRRGFRSQRRLLTRRKNRIKMIKKILNNCNFLTTSTIDKFFNSLKQKEGEYKIANTLVYDETKYINPYVLRVKAQKEKISKEFLAYIIINLAKHRGYLNQFADEEAEKSGLYEAWSKADNLMKNYQTVSEAIINNKQLFENNKILKVRNKNGQYSYLFSRQMIVKELDLILQTQSKYYSELTEDVIEQIKTVINKQRDFEDGPGPKSEKIRQLWEKTGMNKYRTFEQQVGNCKYFPEEKVGFLPSILFELYHLASEVSKISVLYKDSVNLKQAHQDIIEFALNQYNNLKDEKYPSFKNKILEVLETNANTGYIVKKQLIREKAAYKNIEIRLDYLKLLKETFDVNVLSSIKLNDINNHWTKAIGEIINSNITPERREKRINDFLSANNLSFNNNSLDKWLKYGKTGRTNLSFKMMQQLINDFLEGIATNQSVQNYQLHFKNQNNSKEFLAPIKDLDLIKNQTTFRAINQFRKCLKALFRKYSKFESINLETTRELAKSFDERKKIERSNEESKKDNERIRIALTNHNIRLNEMNRLKYKLWEQQNKKCLYSGREITIQDLNSNRLEVDHIIPISVLSDDTINNKALVFKEYNQEKGKMTPLQWMNNTKKDDTFIKTYKSNINRLNISDKKVDYLLTEKLDEEKLQGFVSRNLNDTRYITTYVLSWLQDELTKNFKYNNVDLVSKRADNKYNILPINGKITSFFRRKWLYGSAWGLDQKVRGITVWHHAVDAMILSSFKNKSYIDFAQDIVLINAYKRKLIKHELEPDKFNEISTHILKKWDLNKVYVSFAKQRLQKIIDNNYQNVLPATVINLKQIIEKRIPVKLQIKEAEKEIEVPIEKFSKEKTKKIVKEKIPAFLDVLNENEYLKEVEGLKGNIHYPFVSYKISNKIAGAVTGSEVPMKPTDYHKKLANYKDNINQYVYTDKNGNKWDLANYHGFYLDEEKQGHFVTKFEIQKNKEKYKNLAFYAPYTMFEAKININDIEKWAHVIYSGKSNSQMIVFINGMVKGSKLPSRKSIVQISINNFKSEKMHTCRQPDILGKKM